MPEDKDDLDGCDLDFAEGEVTTDECLPYVALFPDGKVDTKKEAEWKALFHG